MTDTFTAILWGAGNGLEINNAGFEHSHSACSSAEWLFFIFKIVSLECKDQTQAGGGWGMIFPFQMLLNFLQEVLHSSVFSLVFKIIYFGVWEEIFLTAWLSWTDSPVRRHDEFESSVYLLLEVSSSTAIALKRVKQKRKGKGNSSIMKQRMYIISGYIIALDYRNCIKGTHIATSLINSCFCFACFHL